MNENKELTLKNNNYLSDLKLEDGLLSELAGLDTGFDRIKIPAGGGLNFEIPNIENADEPTMVKEFSAVILHHHPLFAYYESKYTGSNNPPDCCSFDGIIGTGTPGGKCASCGFNAFGSGENGSKACKNKHRLYLLREKEIFPIVLVLPASSICELSKYIRRLLSTGRKSDSIVTKLTLKKAVNKTGIAFARVHFGVSRDLEPSEKGVISGIASQIKNYPQNSGVFEEAIEL